MKTVAIIDTHQGGHHFTYLKIFSKCLLDLGCRVVTFCPNSGDLYQWMSFNHPECLDFFDALEFQLLENIQFPILGSFPQPFMILKNWLHAASTIKAWSSKTGHTPDLVFFAWIDNYLSHYLTHHIIDQIFPYNWSGLYFQPCLQSNEIFVPIRKGFLIGHYAIFKSSRCKAVAILNEDISEDLQRQLKNPVMIFPDVTDESNPEVDSLIAQRIREKAQGRRVIGLLGSLNKRKGFMTLLKVSQNMIKENYFFVFVGSLAESSFTSEDLIEIKKNSKNPAQNCFFYFDFIPDGSSFNALINECDILFAAYENFPYSSNLLTKAAIFSKPIIVSKTFCMGQRVEKFELGICIPEGNVVECVNAILYLSQRIELNLDRRQSSIEAYRQLHSVERLRSVFASILQNC